jgi:hypothetical protein
MQGSLWETGFYATESAEPLGEAELNLFLDTPTELTNSAE